MSLKLLKLNPAEQISVGSIITVVGKRNTGKSLIVRELLYKLRDQIDFCVCMTPTASSAHAFSQMMPRACVYDQGLNLEVIDKLMAFQSDCAKRKKRVRSVALVLDDCSWEAKSFRTPAPTLAQLYRNGRHMKITVLTVMQDAMDCSVGLRGQIDCLICLREASAQMRKRLHACWFGVVSLAGFNAIMDVVTENYGALCYLGTVPKNSPTECLFWYRAKKTLPPFRCVNDVFYKYAASPPPRDCESKTNGCQARRGGLVVETFGADSTVLSA